MTFLTRGSGFASRELAGVAGSGQPLPPALDLHMRSLRRYGQLMDTLACNLQRAEPDPAQLEV